MTTPIADLDDPTTLHERPVELLQHLVRFDTTNPPGNERACVEWVADLLAAYDVESETYAADPERPNLIARLPGGDASPLLLYGHVDVVPTAGQDWTHDPFAAEIEDGCVWGRGTLDMKGGVAMYLAAFLRAAAEETDLAGDLVLCILSDEEAGGDEGAGFMVDEHPEVFDGIQYALGEFGAYSQEIAGRKFYPVQVAEKRVCWIRAKFVGQAGHASRPSPGETMVRLGNALSALAELRLPVHVIEPVEEMIDAMAAELPDEEGAVLRDLLDPERTDDALAELDDGLAERLEPVLRNTANPTMVQGGEKENVIPGEVELTLDCRLLPGQTREDVVAELRELWDDEEVSFETIRYEPWDHEADLGLFDHLADVLRAADPGGAPIPLVLGAATDARHFARAGIQTYGFTPMRLPDGFPFMELAHAADERIPVDAVEFGSDAVFEAVRGYDP